MTGGGGGVGLLASSVSSAALIADGLLMKSPQRSVDTEGRMSRGVKSGSLLPPATEKPNGSDLKADYRLMKSPVTSELQLSVPVGRPS